MRPKKSLGQNFLHSTAVRKRIIETANLEAVGESPNTILEIGPGKGFLTEGLLQAIGLTGRVVAVEKDDQLIESLREKFAREITNGHLELIHGDILKTVKNFPRLENYQVVANIPYYITGEILRRFLESPPSGQQPRQMILMLQKEVAERIIARDGKESLLSISVKTYGEPKYVATVKAGSFSPVPKVDSAILAIRNINRKKIPRGKDQEFFQLIKRGFAHKRKLLKSNLGCSTEELCRCKIDAMARAEDLKLDNWICLFASK